MPNWFEEEERRTEAAKEGNTEAAGLRSTSVGAARGYSRSFSVASPTILVVRRQGKVGVWSERSRASSNSKAGEVFGSDVRQKERETRTRLLFPLLSPEKQRLPWCV